MSLKSKVFIAPGAVVCKECELKGEITIGSRTVIHPKARIVAEAGPIIIGENNLIEEQVQILNIAKVSTDVQTVMVIGASNVFEVGAYVESLKIGDNNVLESKCHVGRYTELTSGCVIGAHCEVTCNEIIPENTIIYGSSNCERRIQAEKPAPQTLQLEFLTKILPNYHHLRKPTRTEPK